jgi:hypothetical protein
MSGPNLIEKLMRSSLASNTFDVSVGACVKGNFIDEQGNRREFVEMLRARAVGELTELMLIHVVTDYK